MQTPSAKTDPPSEQLLILVSVSGLAVFVVGAFMDAHPQPYGAMISFFIGMLILVWLRALQSLHVARPFEKLVPIANALIPVGIFCAIVFIERRTVVGSLLCTALFWFFFLIVLRYLERRTGSHKEY